MPPNSTPFTEARTVENPILKWLRTPELGWRYEHQQAVIKIRQDVTAWVLKDVGYGRGGPSPVIMTGRMRPSGVYSTRSMQIWRRPR